MIICLFINYLLAIALIALITPYIIGSVIGKNVPILNYIILLKFKRKIMIEDYQLAALS
jgi:hypothetical protein